MIKVTVAICTWNRAKYLEATLESLRSLEVPAGVEWELLVVNNNCSDNTADVLRRYQDMLPLRPLYEEKPGKSCAANLAIREARGELILWTDDDVLIDRRWLTEYVNAARDWPQAAFFGGTVEPLFASQPPRWLRRHLEAIPNVYSIVRHGDAVRPFVHGEGMVGANIAVRTTVQRHFLFNTRFGPTKDEHVCDEDSDLQKRLLQAGHQRIWVGPARVKHNIPTERMTVSYVYYWFLCDGRSYVRQRGPEDCTTPMLWGAPRWLWRRFFQEKMKYWLYRPLKDLRWLGSLRNAARYRGMIIETALQHRRRLSTECFREPPPTSVSELKRSATVPRESLQSMQQRRTTS